MNGQNVPTFSVFMRFQLLTTHSYFQPETSFKHQNVPNLSGIQDIILLYQPKTLSIQFLQKLHSVVKFYYYYSNIYESVLLYSTLLSVCVCVCVCAELCHRNINENVKFDLFYYF